MVTGNRLERLKWIYRIQMCHNNSTTVSTARTVTLMKQWKKLIPLSYFCPEKYKQVIKFDNATQMW